MGKQMYLGVLVEGSTRPLNQVGAVVGFRWIAGLSDVISTQTVSPYVGVIWALNDSLTGVSASSPGKIISRYGKGKLVFGISLNLSQALNWVGTAASNATTPAPTPAGKAATGG